MLAVLFAVLAALAFALALVLHLIGHGAARFVLDFEFGGFLLLAIQLAVWYAYPWSRRVPPA